LKPIASPLITHRPDQILAWRQDRPITAASFTSDVLRLARVLPQDGHLLNLCEDRYRFMVGFAAAMQRRLITLMPPNTTPAVINNLLSSHSESHCLTDTALEGIDPPQLDFEQLIQQQSDSAADRMLPIDPQQPVAILFTSGSTGQPQANLKRWFNLQQEAVSALSHFPFHTGAIRSLVATVPSQHMYGLATAVVFPWQGGFAVDSGRPFFPADVASALARMPAPRVLITTPLHLRACIAAGIEWPSIAFVISATAPLSAELAKAAETQLKTEVLEIYGSTETGSVAGRRTTQEQHWHLYDGLTLQRKESEHHLSGGHIDTQITLQDRIQIESDGVFRLLGRHSDMVKIAGKRASLSHLTHQLLSIPGIEDGLFLPPLEDEAQARLTALVVAPSLTKAEILDALAHSIDMAFQPRPLYFVDRLPRNQAGKLPQAALRELLQRLKQALS
jgi:acyl-coenzyme A synthetase/AMP-(fatty) acid ligase